MHLSIKVKYALSKINLGYAKNQLKLINIK